MSECNANVNVSSLDNTSTKTSTWPLLCVEKFMYDPSGIVLYRIANIWRLHISSCNFRKYCLWILNCLYCRCGQISVENQLFLTLTKIRQHKTKFELNRLFNISETAVVNIRVTWVNCIFIDNSNTHICITYFFIHGITKICKIINYY